jgi:hypothetical protein
MSYYERWFAALEKRVVAYGFITPQELESGRPAPGSTKATPVFAPAMARSVDRGIPPAHDPLIAPRFEVGAIVRARNINPSGHTRLPRYARGKPDASFATTACTRFQIPMPSIEAKSDSIFTRYVLKRASFGETRLRRAIRFISTCGRTI